MNEDIKYFRIGLFVVVSATLLAFSLIVFGAGKIFEDRISFETYVSGTVQGIDLGSPVKFRGVTIGKVSKISFVFNEYPKIKQGGIYNYVSLGMEVTKPVFPGMFEDDDISEEIQNAVNEGLRARIEPMGITGMNYVEIDYVNPKLFPAFDPPWKPGTTYIPSAPGQITNLLDSVNKIMRDFEHFKLDEIGNRLFTLLTNLNTVVEDADFVKISTDLQEFCREASILVSELNSVIKEANVPELAANTKTSLNAITSAVDDLKRILTNIEPATRINGDDIDASLANFRVISDNLRSLTHDLKQNPSRLIFGSPPPKNSVMEPAVAEPKTKKSPRR